MKKTIFFGFATIGFAMLTSCTGKASDANASDAAAQDSTEVVAAVQESAAATDAENPEAAAGGAAPSATLTATTLYGTISLNEAKASLPNTVNGLYNSMSYTKINKDENMDCPANIDGYYTCKLNGKPTCYIYVGTDNKVCGIMVVAKDVETSEGVRVGMKTSAVARLSGIKQDYDASTGNTIYEGPAHVTYNVWDDDPDIISSLSVGYTY